MDSVKKKMVKNFVVAAIVSAAVSSTLVAVSTGVDSGFVGRWLLTYRFALPLAFVLKSFVFPKLAKVRV